MKVLLTPLGSHGDIHPFVSLGIELSRRGHDVSMISNPHFQNLIERARLTFVPMGTSAEFLEGADNPLVWHPVEGLKLVLNYMMKAMRPHYEWVAQNYVPGNTVVVHSPLGFGARLAQEKLGVPLVTVHLAPSGLRSVARPPRLPHVSLPAWTPGFVHRAIYWAGDTFVVRPVLDKPINAFRAELGLPAIRHPMAGWWNSPRRILGLFPEWFSGFPSDWPAQTRLCGFPLFDESGLVELPADLENFLQAGEAPILFTPGSANLHAHAFFRSALEACERIGRRALFLTMHPEHLPPTLPDTIRHFTYIPFSQVFPRAAAVVHHGGIGTTAQGLAAGTPQLIMPMGFDQPDNADRLVRLGVGAALPVRRFTGAHVAAALGKLLSPDYRRRCEEAATRLRQEQPLRQACDWIEEAGAT